MDKAMVLFCFATTGLFTTLSLRHTNNRVNVAKNKKAIQSSTMFYHSYAWDAALAIDGVRKFKADCECCSCTSGREIPWLEIDLENTYNIGRIDVFGRQDTETQLLGFKLFIGESRNDTLYSEPVYINDVSKTEYLNSKGHFVIPVGNVSIRYIKINNDNDKFKQMCLCEVEVYEACKDFQFEPDCLPCHCSISPCDKVTGRCSSDCLPGWHGESCDIPCEDGRYGVNCFENCSCLNPESCDKETGFCTDGHCMLSWKGHFCNISSIVSLDKKVTMSSVWSQLWRKDFAVDGDTRTNASSCYCCTATNFEVSPWLEIDLGISYRIAYIIIYGRADIIEPKYTFKDVKIYAGAHEDIDNEQPIYSCDEKVTFLNITLDKPVITQFITLKLSGEDKKLVICEVQLIESECENGSFGRLCDKECHCQGKPCDKDTGICPSGNCLAGYLGETCSEECDDRHFGYGCNATCGFCFNNEACDKAQGNCTRCSPGYMGQLCAETCTEGRFGLNCSSYCGMCKYSDVCDHVTGHCPRGCQSGYEKHLCKSLCSEGRFGESCSQFCGHCAGNQTCNITNGHCNGGCIKGFEEPLCEPTDSQVKKDGKSLSVGIIVGPAVAVALAIGLAAITLLIVWRRRKSQTADSSIYAYYNTSAPDAHDYGILSSSRDGEVHETQHTDLQLYENCHGAR